MIDRLQRDRGRLDLQRLFTLARRLHQDGDVHPGGCIGGSAFVRARSVFQIGVGSPFS